MLPLYNRWQIYKPAWVMEESAVTSLPLQSRRQTVHDQKRSQQRLWREYKSVNKAEPWPRSVLHFEQSRWPTTHLWSACLTIYQVVACCKKKKNFKSLSSVLMNFFCIAALLAWIHSTAEGCMLCALISEVRRDAKRGAELKSNMNDLPCFASAVALWAPRGPSSL